MNPICVICYKPASITYSGSQGIVAAFCGDHERVGKNLSMRDLSLFQREENPGENTNQDLTTDNE